MTHKLQKPSPVHNSLVFWVTSRKPRLWIVGLILAALGTACTQLPSPPTPLPSSPPATATPSLTPQPSLTPGASIMPTSTPLSNQLTTFDLPPTLGVGLTPLATDSPFYGLDCPPAPAYPIIGPENAERLKPIHTLGEGRTYKFALSVDGSLLAAATSLGIVLYTTDPPERIRLIPTDSDAVSLAFSPDGTQLVYSMADGRIIIQRTADDAIFLTLDSEVEQPNDLVFSPDGTLLASTEFFLDDIRVWNIADGSLRFVLDTQYPSEAGNLVFSPDGSTLATGTFWISTWDMTTGQRIRSSARGKDQFSDIDYSEDGTEIIGIQTNGQVTRLNSTDLSLIESYHLSTAGIDNLWLSSGKILSSSMGAVMIREAANSKTSKAISVFGSSIQHLALSHDQRLLAALSDSGAIALANLATSRVNYLVTPTERVTEWVSEVAFSSDGRIFVTVSYGGRLRLWCIADGQLLLDKQAGPWKYHYPEAILQDGTMWIDQYYDKLLLWSGDGKHLQTIPNISGYRLDLNNQYVAVISQVGQLSIFRLADESLIFRKTIPDLISVALSPDGRFFATGTCAQHPTIRVTDGLVCEDYSEVSLWQIADGQLLLTRNFAATDLTFSADSEFLLATYDQAILLRTSDGAAMQVFGDDGLFGNEQISPRGDLVGSNASAGWGASILSLWDLSNETIFFTLDNNSIIRAFAFSPDGSLLAVAIENTVYLLAVP